MCSRELRLSREVGQYGPQMSLPTSVILWYLSTYNFPTLTAGIARTPNGPTQNLGPAVLLALQAHKEKQLMPEKACRINSQKCPKWLWKMQEGSDLSLLCARHRACGGFKCFPRVAWGAERHLGVLQAVTPTAQHCAQVLAQGALL